MSQVSRQVGRPITKTATAQAKYATFEQNMKAATKAFRDFEKQCIEDGLLVKEKTGETLVKEHMRSIFTKHWV